MLKLIGSIIIIITSAFFGQLLSSKESYALEDLHNFKKGFLLLKSEINYLKTDLNIAFLKISESINYGPKDIFKDFSESLLSYESLDIQHIWERSFDKNEKKLFINKDIQKNIRELGKIFEYQDIKVLTNNINFLIVQIESQIEISIKKSEEEKKLYNKLFLLGGFLIVVILI